jgi:hypothetical protein
LLTTSKWPVVFSANALAQIEILLSVLCWMLVAFRLVLGSFRAICNIASMPCYGATPGALCAAGGFAKALVASHLLFM